LLCLDRKHILSLILYIVPPYNHHLHRTTITYIPLINLHPLLVYSFIRSNFYCTYLVLTYRLAVATANALFRRRLKHDLIWSDLVLRCVTEFATLGDFDLSYRRPSAPTLRTPIKYEKNTLWKLRIRPFHW
jgi:hypothetical protein